MLTLVLLSGCFGEPERLRSVPTAPTVQLTKPAVTVTWAELDGLFSKGNPELPTVLKGLHVGQVEAEMRAVVAQVIDPRIPSDDEVVRNVTTVDFVLGAFPEVGVSLLLAADRSLDEVQVTLPKDQAFAMLMDAWGPPNQVTVAREGQAHATWTTGPWRAELYDFDKDLELLRLTKPKGKG